MISRFSVHCACMPYQVYMLVYKSLSVLTVNIDIVTPIALPQ